MKDLPDILGMIREKELKEYKVQYDCIRERFDRENVYAKTNGHHYVLRTLRPH